MNIVPFKTPNFKQLTTVKPEETAEAIDRLIKTLNSQSEEIKMLKSEVEKNRQVALSILRDLVWICVKRRQLETAYKEGGFRSMASIIRIWWKLTEDILPSTKEELRKRVEEIRKQLE